MKCFSVHKFEIDYLKTWSAKFNIDLEMTDISLSIETASLVKGHTCISCWASDKLSREVLEILKESGVSMISLRSAGFSHLDINAAKELGIVVTRVPAYSPHAIAEHAVGLLMSINRKLPRAFQRVRDFNFTLEGLEGLTLHGKTVGVVGVGKIGEAFARIMHGFGCKLLFHDIYQNESLINELNATYVDLRTLLSESDVISLHCPLTKETNHLINHENIELIKKSAFLINTSRGGLIETKALIDKLKRQEIRGVALDVYEYEEGIFFHDHSDQGISDDNLLRLMSFPNVLITSHQAFMTKEALENIASISIDNVSKYLKGKKISSENLIKG